MSSQVGFYSLVISQGTRDGGAIASNVTLHRTTHGTISYTNAALFAGTTFGAEVRATNLLGSSRWSQRLIATTPLPTRAPLRPLAPLVVASEESCDVSISIKLPEGESSTTGEDGGCAGAESIELQTLSAGTTSWRTLVRTAATSLTVAAPRDLSVGKAHRFRVVSNNRFGSSSAGEASDAVVGGLPLEMLRPPVVRQTSSASFAIDLPASRTACLEGLVWTVMGRVWPHGWRVVGTGSHGSTVAVEQLRCPDPGCEFKLRPDVIAFAAIESPSVFMPNRKLPKLAANDARVEVRMQGECNNLVRSQLREELKTRLALNQVPQVVETHMNQHAGDTAIVLDLPGPSADWAAQQLADLLTRGMLGEVGSVLSRLERDTGVQQQDVAGKWRPLVAQELIAEAGFTWDPLSMSIAALVALGLCVRCGMLMAAAGRRRRQIKGHRPLAMSEEDAEEEDANARRPSRRMLNDDDFPA